MSEMFQDPYVKAKGLGLDVVLPEPNQLLLDIDDEASEQWLAEMLKVLDENVIAHEVEKTTISKSGKKHVYIKFPKRPLVLDDDTYYVEFDDVGRVALQAALGSDRKRELLSMLQILLKGPHPATVLFEVPPTPDPNDVPS